MQKILSHALSLLTEMNAMHLCVFVWKCDTKCVSIVCDACERQEYFSLSVVCISWIQTTERTHKTRHGTIQFSAWQSSYYIWFLLTCSASIIVFGAAFVASASSTFLKQKNQLFVCFAIFEYWKELFHVLVPFQRHIFRRLSTHHRLACSFQRPYPRPNFSCVENESLNQLTRIISNFVFHTYRSQIDKINILSLGCIALNLWLYTKKNQFHCSVE